MLSGENGRAKRGQRVGRGRLSRPPRLPTSEGGREQANSYGVNHAGFWYPRRFNSFNILW